jgi:hypothetical protein
MVFQSNRRLSRSLERFQTRAPESAIPELPEDPTSLDDRGLMELFTALTAWCEYADEILAEACANEQDAEDAFAAVQAQHTTRSEQKTISAKRAAASLSQDVQRAASDKRNAYRNRKRAEAAVKKTERRLAVVSREITRRSSGPRARIL